MRPTGQLLQHTARITLFTRQNCSLCDAAKVVIQNLSNKRSFDFHQVDVMTNENEKWRFLYEFDTPVLHVQRVFHTYSKPDIVTEARKLMHRFEESQVEELIDEAEGHS